MNSQRTTIAEGAATRKHTSCRNRVQEGDRTFVPFFFVAFVCFGLFSRAFAAESPVVNGDPIVQPNGVRSFRVQGEFRPTLEAARQSARRAAQDRLRQWLATQDPPITRTPSLDQIRVGMNVRDVQTQEEQISSSDKEFKVTLDLDITPNQVRDLRGRERLALGMWTLGGILGVLSVVALLFRLDEWTKGYLTWSLMVLGAGAIVALVLSWWWVQ
jgi:hypothetical protein